MPKPFLHPNDARLEADAIETMLAGLKQWRPDLEYPDSHSDMQACFRALLCCYEIKRRPLPVPLRQLCTFCEGLGKLIHKNEQEIRCINTCTECDGRGYRRLSV